MTNRILLPLIVTTLLSTGLVTVEARQPKSPVSQKKPPSSAAKPKQPQWKIFTPPDGMFTVLMPGIPKKTSQIQKTYMGKIELQIFVAQPPNQEVAYVVTSNKFPFNYAEMTNPQTILNNAQNMALQTTQSRLISQRNIRSSNGHPGKEIKYINSGGKITTNRMFVAQGRLYQVMAMTTKKQHKTLSTTIKGYLNSFQLVLQP
ncbi:MAG: hypothetical protein QNJ63_17950 [Calothrix sp. MO_192.B10]|nr:hypothetical protein [Calothrix sp. MO_192.B10]